MTFRPMLAVAATLEDVKFPVYVSPKLDGVRGVVLGGKLRSRSLKPFPNPFVTERFSKPEYDGLDGELIAGHPAAPDAYRVSNSLTGRMDGEPDVKLHVFDDMTSPGKTFHERYELLKQRTMGLPHVVLVPHSLCEHVEVLESYEEHILSQGFEGLILRSTTGPYKYGRSTLTEQWMMKLKRFEDSEAVIIEVYEQMRNDNPATVSALGLTERATCKEFKVPKGVAGSMLVRDLKTGVEFKVGAGEDAAEEKWFWEHRHEVVGKVIKYKYQKVGVKDKPRFPIYLGFRQEVDMS